MLKIIKLLTATSCRIFIFLIIDLKMDELHISIVSIQHVFYPLFTVSVVYIYDSNIKGILFCDFLFADSILYSVLITGKYEKNYAVKWIHIDPLTRPGHFSSADLIPDHRKNIRYSILQILQDFFGSLPSFLVTKCFFYGCCLFFLN